MKHWVTFAGVAITIVLAVSIVAGELLSQPAQTVVGLAPVDWDSQSIELHTSTGDRLSGWIIPAKLSAGTILLLHGLRGNRRQMLDRARFLHELGYSVMLIDLRSHGESSGDRITFGVREAEGVLSALSYISTNQPRQRIGIIGVSLGAASIVLANHSSVLSAVVLESMYPTIEEAISDRLRLHLGFFGPIFSPLLVAQLPLRFGISPEQLHPIDKVSKLACPVLIASGSLDQHTTLDETERIFNAASKPKELWIVEGAAHVDLHAYSPLAYETRISTFLAKYLREAK